MDFLKLADFHAVAMHGGFSAAARATRTPKGTLSRRICALERDLGVKLFLRGSRALRLTDEGEALRSRTVQALADLTKASDEIAGRAGRPRGRLRMSVPGYFASQGFGSQQGFGALAAQFSAAYPEVVLEVAVQDRFVDPILEGFDIVVRVNPAPDSPLIGQQLYRDQFLVVARPGMPLPERSGDEVPAVVLTPRPHGETWTYVRDDVPTTVRPKPVLRLGSMVLIRDAVLAGAGAGLLPERIAGPPIAAGQLECWGKLVGRAVEVWALHPLEKQRGSKVDAMMMMLLETYLR